MALDRSGKAYITGYTGDPGFPNTAGAYQCNTGAHQTCSTSSSNPSAFIAKFDPSQSGAASLVYSAIVGGNGADAGFGIAVDASDEALVAGQSGTWYNIPNTSTNFPTTPGAYQTKCPSAPCSEDLASWVIKLNPTGSNLVYSTYLGGTSSNSSTGLSGIALGPSGSAYLTGWTNDPNFPTMNPIQNALIRYAECHFLWQCSIPSAGFRLSFSTPFGGLKTDAGNALAVDPIGNAYITGSTLSTNGIAPFFPTTTGAYETGCGDLHATCNGRGRRFRLRTHRCSADINARAGTPTLTSTPSSTRPRPLRRPRPQPPRRPPDFRPQPQLGQQPQLKRLYRTQTAPQLDGEPLTRLPQPYGGQPLATLTPTSTCKPRPCLAPTHKQVMHA